MKIKEQLSSDKYIIDIYDHSKKKKKCYSISTLACFSNYLLNECNCNNIHIVELKKGRAHIEISVNCSYYFVVKKIFSYMKIILENELV